MFDESEVEWEALAEEGTRKQGYLAAKRGEPSYNNPYPERTESVLRAIWFEGYDDFHAE